MASEIWHHGIKGQRWGVKNGPPYPLKPSQRSSREKKAGQEGGSGRQSAKVETKVSGGSGGRRGLTEGQKRALKIAGATILAGAVAYGTYRYAKANPEVVQKGKDLFNQALGKFGGKKQKDIPKTPDTDGNSVKNLQDLADKINKQNEQSTPPQPSNKLQEQIPSESWISESLEDSLYNANPLRGTEESDNNCTVCSIAGVLRRFGVNAFAKSTGGRMQNLGGVLEDCFENIKVLDGSATKFGKSPKDAEEMLLSRFGNNARGVVGVTWKGGGGHAFAWEITNGKVQFLDYQHNWFDGFIRNNYWRKIDPNGSLTLAAIDENLTIRKDGIGKWLEIK